MDVVNRLYVGNGKEVVYFEDGHKEFIGGDVTEWLAANQVPAYCSRGKAAELYCSAPHEEEE